MLHLTDEEFEELMSDLESFRVERKESWSGSAATKGQEDVCAFANDLPGSGLPGILVVGVRDDGTPCGLEVTDQLLQQLAAIKYDGNVLPPPTLTVEKRRLAENDVAVVTVAPSSSPPVRYRGRIWIRTASRRGVARWLSTAILPRSSRLWNRRLRSTLLLALPAAMLIGMASNARASAEVPAAETLLSEEALAFWHGPIVGSWRVPVLLKEGSGRLAGRGGAPRCGLPHVPDRAAGAGHVARISVRKAVRAALREGSAYGPTTDTAQVCDGARRVLHTYA